MLFPIKKLGICVLLLCYTHFLFAQSSNIKLFDFKSSTCEQESSAKGLRTRIIKKEFKQNILRIEIAATATCCVDFIPKIAFSEGVLNLDFEETGAGCECFCCYEFIYKIEGTKNEETKITFRGKEIEQTSEKYLTYPTRYQLLNGDTINYTNRYGLRQGFWPHPKDSLRYFKFIDDSMIHAVELFASKKIKSEVIFEKVAFDSPSNKIDSIYMDNRYIQYYESGHKKKECYHERSSYKKGICIEWNENGEVIYQGEYRE
jgi:hypothetical protein